MKIGAKAFYIAVLLLILFQLDVLRASTLGEVADEQSTLKSGESGTCSVTKTNLYEIRTCQKSAREVKEFVGNDGVVFAVVWHGRTHLDPEKLLGRFYKDSKAAEKATVDQRIQSEQQRLQSQRPRPRGLRKPMHIETSDIVYENLGGHMGNVAGRAYLKPLPSGVTEKELQ